VKTGDVLIQPTTSCPDRRRHQGGVKRARRTTSSPVWMDELGQRHEKTRVGPEPKAR
jgi:hypothetical protein